MFWVISVYFNIRDTLPKSGTFLLEHPVYIITKKCTCRRVQISELRAVTTIFYANKALLTTVTEVWVAVPNSGVPI